MLDFYRFVSQQVTSEKIVLGTLLDDFLEIDAIIWGIVFYGFADHILHPVREKAFLSHWWRKKQELGGHRFIKKACSLCKCLLGTFGMMKVMSKLRGSKFSQMEEWCPQYVWVLWFSGLGAGLSHWSHGFNPCCIHNFFCWINNPCSAFILLNP